MSERPDHVELARLLRAMEPLALALSGGVDSMTLAVFARRNGITMTALHASSAAVPRESTERTRELCAREGIELRVIDAGEMSDENYVANPVDRCFHCKTDLYGAIANEVEREAAVHGDGHVRATIVSGTNLDDLDDYRPGLKAAAARGVKHPFVEARITKEGVRALAKDLGLDDVAEMPAQPCLSSRVETGIRVEPKLLAAIDDVERKARAWVGDNATIRLRVRKGGAVLELDGAVLRALEAEARAQFAANVRASLEGAGLDGALAFEPYKKGSAFLRVL